LIVRFIPETEAEALRAHLEKKLEAPITLDLFIEWKSAFSLKSETISSSHPSLGN
jgi:hypothetical protein